MGGELGGGWDAGNLRSPHIRPHAQGLSARGRVKDGCLMWNLKLPSHPIPLPMGYTITSGLQLQFLLEKQKTLRAQPLPLQCPLLAQPCQSRAAFRE